MAGESLLTGKSVPARPGTQRIGSALPWESGDLPARGRDVRLGAGTRAGRLATRLKMSCREHEGECAGTLTCVIACFDSYRALNFRDERSVFRSLTAAAGLRASGVYTTLP
jgi:hypothetical protein